MIVEADRLREELERACGDASLDPAAFVVWLVGGVRPWGATPIAYLQPAGRVRPGTVAVFRAVGDERAGRFLGTAHRLAVWRELPGLPDAALGPMLRHELEHARRWEASGTAFYEADERLRARVDGHAYALLPTEREANVAAGEYARRVLTAGELDELRASDELAHLFESECPEDVVEATLLLAGEDVPHEPGSVTFRDGPLIEEVE